MYPPRMAHTTSFMTGPEQASLSELANPSSLAPNHVVDLSAAELHALERKATFVVDGLVVGDDRLLKWWAAETLNDLRRARISTDLPVREPDYTIRSEHGTTSAYWYKQETVPCRCRDLDAAASAVAKGDLVEIEGFRPTTILRSAAVKLAAAVVEWADLELAPCDWPQSPQQQALDGLVERSIAQLTRLTPKDRHTLVQGSYPDVESPEPGYDALVRVKVPALATLSARDLAAVIAGCAPLLESLSAAEFDALDVKSAALVNRALLPESDQALFWAAQFQRWLARSSHDQPVPDRAPDFTGARRSNDPMQYWESPCGDLRFVRVAKSIPELVTLTVQGKPQFGTALYGGSECVPPNSLRLAFAKARHAGSERTGMNLERGVL